MQALCETGVGHPAYITKDEGKDEEKPKDGENCREGTALGKSMTIQMSRAK